MPEIPSIGHGSVGPVDRTQAASAAQERAGVRAIAEPPRDRVEVSEHARLLDRLRRLPDIRQDLVTTVRQSIDDGTYETPQKLDAAIQQLLEDLRLYG